MIRATSVLPAGSWTGAPADTVLLDFDARHRRRLAISGKSGVSFLLDLPMAVGLHHGDGLLLEDGRIIAVEAAVEPSIEISAASSSQLSRIAWHIGNRQLPMQIVGDHLRIRPDSAAEAVLAGLGATIRAVAAPFDPESPPHEEEGPWAGFWQGFGDGQSFSESFGASSGPDHAAAHGAFHRSGPAFAEARGHAHASGHSRHSYTRSESHAHSPGHEQHDHAEAENRDPKGTRPRQG
ncbi:MAG: urease accessory protein UreE [Candidatus Kaistia colombiensis]|nr:MAG: urease accessory protein UreE [Kaistia sp.]